MGAPLEIAPCSPDLMGPARALASKVAAAHARSEDFDWLPEGMGKRSVRWRHDGRELVLQIRPAVSFYEPVVEACRVWTAAGANTLPLLSWGSLPDGCRFYVFPFVEWPTAAQTLLSASRSERARHAERIGMAFARLNTVATVGFGEFKVAMQGVHSTWFGFLERRTQRIMATLVERELVVPEVKTKVCALLQQLEPYLAAVSPQLLYVDVKLDNVLLQPDGEGLCIVDYDYLLSGDGLWSAGRIAPIYGRSDVADAMRAGFLRELGCADVAVLQVYELLHTLELLTTPVHSPELAARRERLIRALGALL